MRDLYDILGVDRDATAKEIKKAHRRLVKKHHPDINDGQQSQEFIDIQKAYEVLLNPETRSIYDGYGFTKLDERFNALSMLAGALIQQCINAGAAPGQLINEAERLASRALTELENKRDGIEKYLDKLRAQKDALKAKNSLKFDLMGQALLNMIAGSDAELLQIKSIIEVHEQLSDFLSKYEKGAPPAHVNNFSTSSINFGTGAW